MFLTRTSDYLYFLDLIFLINFFLKSFLNRRFLKNIEKIIKTYLLFDILPHTLIIYRYNN
jgi:hypothetical protein